ncbi:MAG: glycosyltransferase, partial [Spirochaeta sp.]|nr:glycosyltransferase [Spirochaeta sp.]
DSFLSAADSVLKGIPGFDTSCEHKLLRDTSIVVYPGVEHASGAPQAKAVADGPVIVWNHRWEADKQPGVFRRVIEQLDGQGMAFSLILLGEHPAGAGSSGKTGGYNPEFEALCSRFSQHIIHSGYAQDRAEYFRLLRLGDIVVSTAKQENFGLSMLQAIDAGCWPLAPKRLAYPEVLPAEVHALCLYKDMDDLIRKITALWGARLSAQPDQTWEPLRNTLLERAAEFHWERRIREFDDLIEETVALNC